MQKTLVLIHGMGRLRWSMAHILPIGRWYGYRVINFSYRPSDGTISEIAGHLSSILKSEIEPGSELYFLTHSLGSIILRYLICQQDVRRQFGHIRAVMLGPPNQGSVVARKLFPYRLFSYRFGAPFEELANGQFPPVPESAEIGVIAGVISRRFSLHPLISEPNDGIVALSETTLEGAIDHRIIRCPHAVMMYAPSALKSAFYFFKHGSFPHRR